MKTKPVVPRSLANRDINRAIDYYLKEAGEAVALEFIDALERAFDHLTRHPASASPRYAHEFDVPGLRFWSLRKYPYLIFFVEQPDCVDVWRVLHAERDIPTWLRAGDDP